jgi:acyl-CoA synthetase (AMP-forming)/AMP-acid ligase II
MPALLQNSVAVGVLVHTMMSMHHGMEVVMMKKYTFDKLTDYARRYDLSMLFLAPPIWNRIVNEWKKEDLTKIRWALSGGSPMPLALQKRVNKALPEGTVLLPNWGMTELVCAATQFSPDEVDEEGSVGRLVPAMEAIIVGSDDKELDYNQPGELLVKGKLLQDRDS